MNPSGHPQGGYPGQQQPGQGGMYYPGQMRSGGGQVPVGYGQSQIPGMVPTGSNMYPGTGRPGTGPAGLFPGSSNYQQPPQQASSVGMYNQPAQSSAQPSYPIQQQPTMATTGPAQPTTTATAVPTQATATYVQQQPTASSAIASAAPSTSAGVPSAPTASTAPNPRHEQPHTSKKKELNPPPYNPQILENLSNLTIDGLCIVGKELIHELNCRTYTLCSAMKASAERKPATSGQDVEMVTEYCTMLFDKLAEIRVLVENKYQPTITPGNVLHMLTDMTPPDESDVPESLKKKREKFAENSRLLASLNRDLKQLDWQSTVSDPNNLRKVDRLVLPSKGNEL